MQDTKISIKSKSNTEKILFNTMDMDNDFNMHTWINRDIYPNINMAAVNSVQSGLHLPLAGLSPPRVLMCSASMGAEGSVTLQLREAIHSSDSSSVDGYSSLDNALTIGYPDPDMLADVLGSLQTASLNNNSNSNNTMISAITLENVDGSKLNDIGSAISSNPNNNNNNNGGKSNSNNNSLISCSSNISLNSPISGQIISITGSSSGSSGSSSNCSTTSNSSCSSSSNESISNVSVPGSNPPIVKKQRPKTSSPTRHGPQQCQVCSKVFGNASALAKHKLTHSDERKYVCVMCSKAFKRQDHLNGHMMTHRNKKPYECKAEGCGKSYCDARSLRRHTENHHSGLAAAATTPQNQSSSLSPSTGPPTGLSLSPATASGDASSPHGANCIQYTTMGGGDDGSGSNSNSSVKQSSSAVNVSVVSSSTQASSSSQCYSVTSSPASSPSSNASIKSVVAGDGLTRQQLDLISQIMQQTKQGNTQLTVGSTTANLKITNQPPSPHQSQAQSTQHQLQRPRTWNMQTQLQQTQSKVSVIENSTSPMTSISINELLNGSGPHQQQQQQQHQQQQQQNQQNLSSAASINQQILNIVKIEQKPVECNLCHRKFKNVPALNGHMRLHGGYFKKEAETKKCDRKDGLGGPPLQTASIGVRALIEEKIISKRCKDLKGAFVVPAPPITAAIRRTASDLENFLTPKSPIVLQSGSSPLERNNSLPDIGNAVLPSGLQIQKQPIPVSQKPSNVSVGTATVSTNTSKATSTMDHKDATLIELLKRGTKVAVRKTSNSDSSQIFTTSSGTLMLPSELSLSNNSGTSNPPLAITLPNGETTPVSLTISQAPNGSGDVYTLTYSTDSAASFFEDSDVYSVSETDMLLQTVDSIQLLNEPEDPDHLDEINSLADFHNDTSSSSSNLVSRNSKDMQTVFSSPLQDALPDFQTLHSKDFVLYNNGTCKAINSGTNHTTATKSLATVIKQAISPLPSPLAYPTPPASHEMVAQASPFLDDSHHFSDAANSFFQEKSTSDFIDDAGGTFFKDCSNEALTESQKILKLKSVLEDSGQFFKSGDDISNDVFDTSVVKVEDLLNESSDGANCDLKDFAEQNLSFLEDAQGFLDDSRNATSPLSESFFTSGIGTAEEVKEVLRDVLPDESLNCDPQNSTDIDLYYLPGLGLQSQMMPNSEDPLLSSSPRDFGHRLSVQPHHQQTTQMIRMEPQQAATTLQGQLLSTKPDPDSSFPLLMATSTSKDGSTEFHFTIQQQEIKQDNETDIKPDISTSQMCVDNQLAAPQLPPPPFKDTSAPTKTLQFFGANEIHAQQMYQQPQNILAVAATASPLTSSILKRRLRQGSMCGDSSFQSSSVPRKYELYKSKLRKPSTTHYTPQPILNPGRKGTGLYSNLPKPPTFAQDALHLDDEFEEAASIMAFLDESKVNIGTAYQATIPALETRNELQPMIIGGQLSEVTDHEEMMWDPSVASDEKILTRYIELSKSSAIPLGYHSEEVALKALLQVHGDTPIAVLNLLKSQSNPFHLKWSSLEVEMFLRGLEKYGKDFYSISREIITKSTSECIQLYYFWKKLCVDYKMTHLKVENDDASQLQYSSQVTELRPHVCEMPDCSASFTSKAALHGHTRIHCIGRNMNQLNNNNSSMILANNGQLQSHSNLKDDFPCKVCGKVFNKVKSRSAHMKSHRPQENDSNTSNLPQQQLQQQPQQQQSQQNTNSL